MTLLPNLSPSVFCAILTLFHQYSILSSVQCAESTPHRNGHVTRRALFNTREEHEGLCSFKFYHNATNGTKQWQHCNSCSLKRCHETDHEEIENLKSLAKTHDNQDDHGSNRYDKRGGANNSFELVQVDTEQALLEEETGGHNRHLFISFDIECQIATTVQTLISIDKMNVEANKGAAFCHQIDNPCKPSDQYRTFVTFSEVLQTFDVYVLNMLFYANPEAVIENGGGQDQKSTKRTLVAHEAITLAQPPIRSYVSESSLVGSEDCNWMSEPDGYTQWQTYAVILTVLLFMLFLASLVIIALRKHQFESFFKSKGLMRSHKSMVRLKINTDANQLEDDDCGVLIETDEDVDYDNDDVFVARNRQSSGSRS